MTNGKNSQVHIRLNEKKKRDFQIELMRSGQTMQQFLENAINEFLENSGQTKNE